MAVQRNHILSEKDFRKVHAATAVQETTLPERLRNMQADISNRFMGKYD